MNIPSFRSCITKSGKDGEKRKKKIKTRNMSKTLKNEMMVYSFIINSDAIFINHSSNHFTIYLSATCSLYSTFCLLPPSCRVCPILLTHTFARSLSGSQHLNLNPLERVQNYFLSPLLIANTQLLLYVKFCCFAIHFLMFVTDVILYCASRCGCF